jgi:tetratricopeptide (TPR) repeat protein
MEMSLSGSLKRFLFIKLSAGEEQQCQLFEPEGRVLALPGASFRFIKRCFRTREKGFGQQPFNDRLLSCIWVATVGFCLAGQLLCAACSKTRFGEKPHLDTTWVCDEEADDAMRGQDYEAGIHLHQRFLEKQPENGLALYHLGYAYGQTGDRLNEVSYYERAVALGFFGGRIFFNMGMAYGELNQPERSIRAFKKALDIEPDSADNHFGLALAYQGNAEDRLAEEAFLKTISIDPAHPDARLYLAMLYADGGHLKKAAEQLRKLLEIHPSHRPAREFLERIEGE